MSAASPVPSQVRRNAAAAPSRSPQQQIRPAAQAPQTFAFAVPRSEDEFCLNLSDLPLTQDTLDVEAFKPSLLSRLFDVFTPLKR